MILTASDTLCKFSTFPLWIMARLHWLIPNLWPILPKWLVLQWHLNLYIIELIWWLSKTSFWICFNRRLFFNQLVLLIWNISLFKCLTSSLRDSWWNGGSFSSSILSLLPLPILHQKSLCIKTGKTSSEFGYVILPPTNHCLLIEKKKRFLYDKVSFNICLIFLS